VKKSNRQKGKRQIFANEKIKRKDREAPYRNPRGTTARGEGGRRIETIKKLFHSFEELGKTERAEGKPYGIECSTDWGGKAKLLLKKKDGAMGKIHKQTMIKKNGGHLLGSSVGYVIKSRLNIHKKKKFGRDKIKAFGSRPKGAGKRLSALGGTQAKGTKNVKELEDKSYRS